MLRKSTYSLLLVIALVLMAGTALALPEIDAGNDKDGNPLRPICATEEVWEMRKAELGLLYDKAACGGEGVCDDPSVRDAAPNSPITVRVVMHVITNRGNLPSGLATQDITDQITQLNVDYAPYNVDFDLQGVQYHDDRKLSSVSAYSSTGRWWSDIMSIKDKYNDNPGYQMNIYISGMDNGVQGVLLGIATFPWDPDATATRGGLWLNSQYVGAGQGTASHEMGHCLGLWHTHHGVSETAGCSDSCFENAHSRNDAAADYVGDFCKDTMPTPTNYYCSPPGGTDCNGASWGTTDTGNYMGYAPDTCYDHFSGEQNSRMSCWSLDRLSGLIDAGCTDSAPSAAGSLAANAAGASSIDLGWTDNSGNEDGFRVERDAGGGYSQVGTVGSGVTSYTDSGLDCETSYSYRVVAYNCGGNATASNIASAVTGTCPQGAVAHVSAIDLNWTKRGQRYNAYGTVTVVDASGSPVSGATVSVGWSGTTSSSQSAVTASNGQASFTSSKSRTSSNCWTLTVNNVTMAGGSYDAGANVVSSGSAGTACGAARVNGQGNILFASQGRMGNGSAEIQFAIDGTNTINLQVFDMRGHLIRNLVDGVTLSGDQVINWDGRDVHGQRAAQGVYFFRLQAGQSYETGKVALIH